MWVLAACLVTVADSTEKHKIGQLLQGSEGGPETFVLHSQTAAVLLTFQLFLTTLYFSIYHLRLGRAEITQITFHEESFSAGDFVMSRVFFFFSKKAKNKQSHFWGL